MIVMNKFSLKKIFFMIINKNNPEIKNNTKILNCHDKIKKQINEEKNKILILLSLNFIFRPYVRC